MLGIKCRLPENFPKFTSRSHTTAIVQSRVLYRVRKKGAPGNNGCFYFPVPSSADTLITGANCHCTVLYCKCGVGYRGLGHCCELLLPCCTGSTESGIGRWEKGMLVRENSLFPEISLEFQSRSRTNAAVCSRVCAEHQVFQLPWGHPKTHK